MSFFDFGPLFLVYVFLMGCVVGSFLNVCIHRLPRSRFMMDDPYACPHCSAAIESLACPSCGGELMEAHQPDKSLSVGSTRSKCPKCGELIRFYDNIPIVSYFVLRGRCRHCKAAISVRYPIVELLAGLLALACLATFGPSITGLIYFALICTLLVISFIDIDLTRIPMIITLPGVLVGFVLSPFLPGMNLLESLGGILAGAGGLYLMRQYYWLVRRAEGMGGGDVDLAAMLGAFLGWQGVLFSLVAGAAIGLVAGIVLMIVRKKGLKLAVPFGPFLALGALLFIFFGRQIIYWYLGIMV
ncbi:MAG: A24 family peptidase [Desulfatibacillaceae bacterium]|nr:A24 family peptidase [Desulfatibacillaceae bacterium]